MKSNRYNASWLFLVFSLVLPVSLYADSDCCLSITQDHKPEADVIVKKLKVEDLKKKVSSDEQFFSTDFYDDTEGAIATVNMSLYDVKNEKEHNKVADRYGDNFRPIFNTGIRPFIYLSYFKIFKDQFKNQGLGKQFFEYGLQEAKKMYPNAMYFWRAVPLDGPDKKDALFRFYKNRGGIMLKDLGSEAIFYIDLAKLPKTQPAAAA